MDQEENIQHLNEEDFEAKINQINNDKPRNEMVNYKLPHQIPDTPISKKHIWGYYGYSMAYLPYTLAIGNLIVPMLESAAVRSAFKTMDPTSKCEYNLPNYQCSIYLGSWFLSTTSFTLYTSALGVVLQGLFLLAFSSLADFGNYRSRFILIFGILGSLLAGLYIALPIQLFLLMALFSILANASNVISSAFFYSYLPVYTRNHPSVLVHQDFNIYLQARDKVANQLSVNSFSLGMISTFIVSLTASLLSYFMGSSPFTLQLGASMAAIWWLILGSISYYFLPKPNNRPLPPNRNPWTHSIYQLIDSTYEIQQALDIVLGLLSNFFISDGLSTLLFVSIFVGRSSLSINSTDTLFMAAFAPLAEAVGIIFLNWIKNKVPSFITTKRMVIFLTLLSFVFSVWGLLGHYTSFGIKSKPEYFCYYILAVTIYASLQSFHRVLFAELVPIGRESEYFGVYSLSTKGSSWIGSLAVGAINSSTNGQIRLGFVFVMALFLAGLICVVFIDTHRGTLNKIKLKESNEKRFQ